jgi:hypothetical protein
MFFTSDIATDDASLATLLANGANPLKYLEAAASAYTAASRLYRAPVALLQRAWDMVRNQYHGYARPVNIWAPPSDKRACEIAQLRTAIEGHKFFAAYLAMTPAELEAAWVADRNQQNIAHHQHNLAHAAASAPPVPSFSPSAFVADLAKRGVMLSAEDGDIRVVGATEADKATLRQHKSAVVAVLAAAEVI